MTGNRQANMSVLVAPPVSQNIPQLIVQPVQATEFMTILAKMMSLLTPSRGGIEKGFQGAQWLQPGLRKKREQNWTRKLRKIKSKTDLDKDVEDPLKLDEPDNDLPFQSVPEHEAVPSEQLENERHEKHIEPEKHVPAYKTHMPVEDLELDDLLDRILKVDVMVKLGTLLKSVKGTWETLQKLLTSKWVPIELKMAAKIESMNDNGLKYWETYTETNDLVDLLDIRDLSVTSYTILCEATQGLPKGSVVASDPVLQYLNSLPTNENPKLIFIVQESYALRTVFPLINGKAPEKSILNGGFQIVSMSKASAEELGLTWDPQILIYMQSANGQFEKSLGLAKNVPFKFSAIVVYL